MNIKQIITEEIQKSRSKENLLTEGLSDIVYHFTYTSNLISILKMDKFATSSNLGSSADASKDKGKYFFFSTQRTKGLSGYGSKNGNNVAFVLDGRKLSYNYKGSPTDYWNYSMNAKDYSNPNDYRHALLSKELEDRIITNKPYIDNAKNYIKEIHIYVGEENTHLIDNKEIKEILNLAGNIPVYFYTNQNDYRAMNKSKAIPADKIKLEDKPEWMIDTDRSSISLYNFHKLASIIIFKNEYDTHNDEKEKIKKLLNELLIKMGEEDSYDSNMQEIMDDVNRYKYMGYGDDIYRSLSADIHNKRGNPDPFFRELLRMLIADMRKWHSKDLKTYINKKINKE